MKREIKFRGRNNGVWEYGNLIIADNGSPYIFPPEICETDGHHLRQGDDAPHWVDPATVGQYTGLKDRNGREIYEGDIVKDRLGNVDVLTYDSLAFNLCVAYDSSPNGTCANFFGENNPLDRLEVIGNVHDNPEMLNE